MANSITQGFGLIPLGTLGSSYSNQGQSKYVVEAAYSDSDLFQGCTVRVVAGYIEQASLTRTLTCLGVFNGIFYNASTTLKPTWANWYNQPITPANSEDLTAFVIDDPTQLFVVSTDGAIAQAGYGKTYGLTVTAAGSETSGQSSSTLTVGTVSVTANQWRLLRTAEDSENNDITTTNCSVIVCQNLCQFLQNTGTAGITWQ